jgi:hypothetical protein
MRSFQINPSEDGGFPNNQKKRGIPPTAKEAVSQSTLELPTIVLRVKLPHMEYKKLAHAP